MRSLFCFVVVAVVTVVTVLATTAARAAPQRPWLGATALLQKTAASSPTQALDDNIQAFIQVMPTLSADAAARRFDALVLEARKLDADVGTVLSALPPPASWPLLRTTWQARAASSGAGELDRTLAAFGAMLVDGIDKSRPVVEALHLPQHGFRLTPLPPSPRARVDELLKGTVRSFGDAPLLGDLVGEVGEVEARRLLLQLLQMRGRPFRAEGRTLALAKQLAVDHVATLAAPPWALLTRGTPPAVYDAIEQRFVPPGAAIGSSATMPHADDNTTYDQIERARVAYIVELLRTDRRRAARSFALSLERSQQCTDDLVAEAQAADVLPQLVDIVFATVKTPPSTPRGTECLATIAIDAALRVGRGRALAAALPASSRDVRGRIWRQARIDLALALDDTRTAVTTLSSIVDDASEPHADRLKAAGRLLKIGVAVADDAVAERGVAALLERCRSAEEWSCNEELEAVRAYLLPREQGMRLEALLRARLNSADGSQRDWVRTPILAEAVVLYALAGRSSDAMQILETTEWNEADVVEMQARNDGMVVAVARALTDLGRRAEASRLLRAALLQAGSGRHSLRADDDAWALLAAIDGAALIGFIDELRTYNALEERPLIWKAWLLAEQGDHVAAEVAARAAIQLDPADGDSDRGKRFRAYVVLAEILRATNRAGEATVYDDAVAAIRIGEDGDRQREAGLLTRAAQTYRRALNRFDDAYCLQSRLGVVEQRLGVTTALDHLKRAYQLLPSSFGRLESHCLACDGLYASTAGLQLGETVLREHIATAPDDARAHYFLGRVLEERQELSAARDELLRAFRLDVGYVAALRALGAVEQSIPLGAERTAIGLARLRNDPECSSGHCRVDVDDLAAIYLAAPPLPPTAVGFALKRNSEMAAPRSPARIAGAAAVLATPEVFMVVNQLSSRHGH